MGQMAVQVVGLSLFLVLVFCVAVTALGEGSEGPKAESTGIHCLRSHPVSTSKLNWFKRD